MWSSTIIPNQITCPSKPFLNGQTKRYEPVPSLLIGFIIIQWLLWHKENFLCFCKFIFSCFLHLLLRNTHLQGLFVWFLARNSYREFLWGDVSALRSHIGTSFSWMLILLIDCSWWVSLIFPCWCDLFETVSLDYSPPHFPLNLYPWTIVHPISPCKYVLVNLLFYHCLLVEGSQYFYIT